jgi:hypothetical protein
MLLAHIAWHAGLSGSNAPAGVRGFGYDRYPSFISFTPPSPCTNTLGKTGGGGLRSPPWNNSVVVAGPSPTSATFAHPSSRSWFALKLYTPLSVSVVVVSPLVVVLLLQIAVTCCCNAAARDPVGSDCTVGVAMACNNPHSVSNSVMGDPGIGRGARYQNTSRF